MFITITQGAQVPSRTTVTIPPSGNDPGTVLILIPGPVPTAPPLFVTSIRPYYGATTATVTLFPTLPGALGTVLILTPAYITTTAPGANAAIQTITIRPAGTAPGTILILTPSPGAAPVLRYVTQTQTYTGTVVSTITELPGRAGDPGTVIGMYKNPL